MDLKNIIRKVIKESVNKKILNEGLQIKDISGSSTYPKKPLKGSKYFILHHTAGLGTAEQVLSVLNKRKLGIHYIIDGLGDVYKTLNSGTEGAHIKSFYPSAPKDMSNETAVGVEIVGKDNNDITKKQCKSALLLVKSLGFSLGQIYGHGEVSWNKGPDEGLFCKSYMKKYWNTPVEKLPSEKETKLPEFTITAKKK
jgi:N-acetyl-anhydromuramyl-L-alanine amidase AmpD